MADWLSRSRILDDDEVPMPAARASADAVPVPVPRPSVDAQAQPDMSWLERSELLDPFEGEAFADTAARRGQQFAQGAVDVAASQLEALDVQNRELALAVEQQAPERVRESYRSALNLRGVLDAGVSPLSGAPMTDQERATYQQRYDDAMMGVRQWASVERGDLDPTAGRSFEKPARAIREGAAETFGTPDERDRSFWGQVAQGAGNMTALASSVFLGPAGLPAGAAMGANMNRAQVYREAIEAGASEADALEASRWGAAIGATEIIPISRALKMLPPRMRPNVSGALMKRFADVAQSAGEEAAQEYLATVANNMVAQGYYDPERGWNEGAAESALVGLVLGAGIGTIGAVANRYEDTGIEPGETPVSRPPEPVDLGGEAPPTPEPLGGRGPFPPVPRQGTVAQPPTIENPAEADQPLRTSAPETAPEAAPTPAARPDVDVSEAAILMAAGDTVDDIVMMNPAERRAAAAQAIDDGVAPIPVDQAAAAIEDARRRLLLDSEYLTDSDRAAPLPNEMIDTGKRRMDELVGEANAPRAPDGSPLPGQRIRGLLDQIQPVLPDDVTAPEADVFVPTRPAPAPRPAPPQQIADPVRRPAAPAAPVAPQGEPLAPQVGAPDRAPPRAAPSDLPPSGAPLRPSVPQAEPEPAAVDPAAPVPPRVAPVAPPAPVVPQAAPQTQSGEVGNVSPSATAFRRVAPNISARTSPVEGGTVLHNITSSNRGGRTTYRLSRTLRLNGVPTPSVEVGRFRSEADALAAANADVARWASGGAPPVIDPSTIIDPIARAGVMWDAMTPDARAPLVARDPVWANGEEAAARLAPVPWSDIPPEDKQRLLWIIPAPIPASTQESVSARPQPQARPRNEAAAVDQPAGADRPGGDVAGAPAGVVGEGESGPRAGAANTARVVTPAGQEIEVAYEVVDASSLTAASGDLQPRDRSRASSDEQIADIAANLDPARLMPAREADRGAPIVGPDNIVESGNGRIAALRRAADLNPEGFEAYRREIERQGYEIPPGVRVPILVGKRVTNLTTEQRRSLVAGANRSATARMSATEQAQMDADALTPAVLGVLDTTRPVRGQQQFTREFLANLPQSERGPFTDENGELSSEGARRIEQAIFARAYGDREMLSRIAEEDGDTASALLKAMQRVAPKWMEYRAEVQRGEILPEYDFTQPLLDAVRLLTGARETAKRQGIPVNVAIDSALGQQDIFAGDVDPRTKALVRAFHHDDAFKKAKGTDRIAEMLSLVVDEARTAGAGGGLLPDAQAAPQEVVRAAGRRTEIQQGGDQLTLPVTGRRGAPDSASAGQAGQEAQRPERPRGGEADDAGGGRAEGEVAPGVRLAPKPKKPRNADDIRRLAFKSMGVHAAARDKRIGNSVDVMDAREGRELLKRIAEAPDDLKARRRIADEWVVDQGRATGDEHLVALDEAGIPVEIARGIKSNVNFSQAIYDMLAAGRRLHATHNHPQGRGFSPDDLVMLAYGLESVTAVGHNGDRHEARLSLAARHISKKAMRDVADAADGQTQIFIQRMVNDEAISVDVANAQHANATAALLARVGVIDYMGDAEARVADSGIDLDAIEAQHAAVVADRVRRAGVALPEIGNPQALGDAAGDAGRDAGPSRGNRPDEQAADEGDGGRRVQTPFVLDPSEGARAYAGVSMRPEQRAQADIAEYDGWVAALNRIGESAQTPEQQAAFDRALSDLRRGYVQRQRALWRATEGSMSSSVTGRGGVGRRQAQRRNAQQDRADRARDDLVRYANAAPGVVRDAIRAARSQGQVQDDANRAFLNQLAREIGGIVPAENDITDAGYKSRQRAKIVKMMADATPEQRAGGFQLIRDAQKRFGATLFSARSPLWAIEDGAPEPSAPSGASLLASQMEPQSGADVEPTRAPSSAERARELMRMPPLERTDKMRREVVAHLEGRRSLTASEEAFLALEKARIAADPAKWNIGDGVGYRVAAGGRLTQVNRGFRIVSLNPEMKTVVVRQVADTGITSTGGNSDRVANTEIHIAELVRDRKYDAPTAVTAPDSPPPANAPLRGTIQQAMQGPLIEHTTQRGKLLQGYIVRGISKDEALEVDQFTFRKDGGYFIRTADAEAYLEGDDASTTADDTATEPEAAAREDRARRMDGPAARISDADRQALQQRLAQIAPGVQVAFQADLRATDGRAIAGLMRLQRDPGGRQVSADVLIGAAMDPAKTLNHEALHALYHMGAFTDAEWGVLTRRARGQWVRQFRTDERYSDQSEAIQIEEAIAEAFGYWSTGRLQTAPAGIRASFERIRDFMEAFGNWLRGMGFQSAEDVLDRVGRGEVGRRPRDEQGRFVAREDRPLEGDEPFRSYEHRSVRQIERMFAPGNWGALADARSWGDTRALIMRNFADSLFDLKRQQKAIEEARGEPLPLSQDAYAIAGLYVGRTGERLQKFYEDDVRQIAREMRAAGISQEQMDDYLVALHAEERNAHVGQLYELEDPEHQFVQAMTDASVVGGSGMSNAEARKIIRDTAGRPNAAAFRKIAGHVRRLLDQSLDIQVASGLTSAEAVEAMRATYTHYVPLRGFAGEEAETQGTGRGFDIRGAESRRATGRRSRSDSPLSYAFAQVANTIIRAEKNRVGKTVLRLVENNPNKRLWEVDRSEVRKTVKRKAYLGIDPDTGLPMMVERDQVVAKKVPPNRFDPDVMIVKVGGDEVAIRFKNRTLAAGLKNLNPENTNTLVRLLQKGTRFMAAMNTSYNVEWFATNMVRDIMTAGIQITDEGRKNLQKQMFKNFPAAFVGGARYFFTKRTDTEWAKIADDFVQNGGRVSYIEFRDVEGMKATIQSEIDPGAFTQFWRGGPQKLFDSIDAFTSAGENAIRIAAYKAAIDLGMSKTRAAIMARNLTVDFNRKGTQTWINAAYMFFNAAVQGNVRLIQSVATSRFTQRALGGLMTIGLLEALMGDDEYEKVEDYVRERNIVIPLSLFGGEEGAHAKIPLPYGFNVFKVIGSEAGRVIRRSAAGDDARVDEAAVNIVLAALNSFNPIGGSNFDTIEGALTELTPSVLSPVTEIAVNRNFFGNTIAPDYPGDMRPPSEQYYPTVSAYARGITAWLNDATGGNTFRAGLVSLNPEHIDHLIGAYLGGVGRLVERTFNTASDVAAGRETTWEKTPFARNFYGRTIGEMPTWRQYDRLSDAAELLDAEISGLQKAGRMDEMREARERDPAMTRLLPLFKSQASSLQKIRKEEREIRGTDMPETLRDERIQRLRQRQYEIQRRAIERYDAERERLRGQ